MGGRGESSRAEGLLKVGLYRGAMRSGKYHAEKKGQEICRSLHSHWKKEEIGEGPKPGKSYMAKRKGKKRQSNASPRGGIFRDRKDLR